MVSAHILPRLALGAFLMLAGIAHAQDENRLADLINDYRNSPQTCDGRQVPMTGVLAPSAALSRVRPAAGHDLGTALRQAGYRASRAGIVSVSGPSRPEDVMALLRERYCHAILDARFSEIGISRSGTNWQIVFAQPVVSAELGDWRQAGKTMLDLVNQARSRPRTCGNQRFQAAPGLAWDDRLAEAALAHSRDMAQRNYFSHEAANGSTAADRATQQGYSWQRIGENIAAGQDSPQKTVAGWLASPGHCANIMNPHFREMGAAFALNRDSDQVIYWTQVFGTPQRASPGR